MCDRTLQFFRSRGLLTGSDAAQIMWSHGVNSRNALAQALTGPCHMIEADVTIRGHDPKEPIMAHPPHTDSDITLKEWLEEVTTNNKGIKLDFKRLEAVSPSLALLEHMLPEPNRPVWINADILSGPGGQVRPVDSEVFLSVVTALHPQTMLSLGWTTGWSAGTNNPASTIRLSNDQRRTSVWEVQSGHRCAMLTASRLGFIPVTGARLYIEQRVSCCCHCRRLSRFSLNKLFFTIYCLSGLNTGSICSIPNKFL
ncbi:protein FAM151B isoform X2 [Fundulus heteroclitus]|uniref:protein FAM151B isoform X2 n=1 Tax=Fundulus heteroclitus TaxID=8078 RepID=UPI000B3A42E1|nr:protein FAM151B isoform X2 [Fundulus heteroclitus]